MDESAWENFQSNRKKFLCHFEFFNILRTAAFGEIFRIPQIWSTSLTLIIMGLSFGFLQPTLSLYCKNEYDMTVTEMGIVFAIPNFVYVCFASISG